MGHQLDDLNILILAAGKGTRMYSSLPKVLHPLGGLPLIGHVINCALHLKPKALAVLISPDQADLKGFITKHYPTIQIVYQDKQLGTGHGVRQALEQWPVTGNLLVTFGDTPLVTPEALTALASHLETSDLALAAMKLEDGAAYGRICRDSKGQITHIVEFKHASDTEKQITEVNGGFMGLKLKSMTPLLAQLPLHPETGEYYLTDLVTMARDQNHRISVATIDPIACAGINSRQDLAYLEGIFQNKRRQEFLNKGVTLQDPQSVYFSHDTRIEADVTIEPHVYFGPGVTIESGSIIKAFSHLEGATIAKHCVVGPFARLRPGTKLEEQAKVGNFVELKNATLGPKSKVNHLSYVGDATLGRDVNIGAGTITCNYDGTNKWQTTIEDGVFIGSNTALVAPLTIGAQAIVGAGSTVTQDVPAGSLSLTRAPIKHIENGGHRVRQQNLSKKKQKESPTCAA